MSKAQMEIEIRERVLKLQSFYKSLTAYCFVNAVFVIMWILFNNDYFWPILFILPWGGYLAFRAFRLGLVPLVEEMFPFMDYRWVEEEVERRLRRSGKESSKKAESAPAVKKVAAKKAPAKKPAAKKPAAKKTTTKKVTKKPSAKK